MGSGVTVCFYLVIGLGVAGALWLCDDTPRKADHLFRTLTAPFFWPIYVPVLLARQPAQSSLETFAVPASRSEREVDGMASMISQVETELDTALRSLDGWAEDVLSGEQHRISELRTAWHLQANHIRELDQLLEQTSIEMPPSDGGELDMAASIDSDETQTFREHPPFSHEESRARQGVVNHNQVRITEYERSRNENILKLKRVRRQLYEDLMATLAWVRELVTMIHLAKYTGAPASRALELVQQIAAAVEGVSEVNQYTSPSAH